MSKVVRLTKQEWYRWCHGEKDQLKLELAIRYQDNIVARNPSGQAIASSKSNFTALEIETLAAGKIPDSIRLPEPRVNQEPAAIKVRGKEAVLVTLDGKQIVRPATKHEIDEALNAEERVGIPEVVVGGQSYLVKMMAKAPSGPEREARVRSGQYKAKSKSQRSTNSVVIKKPVKQYLTSGAHVATVRVMHRKNTSRESAPVELELSEKELLIINELRKRDKVEEVLTSLAVDKEPVDREPHES